MADSVAGRRKRGVSFSPAKAREMIENPPHGKALTGPQHRLFEMVAHGGTPNRVRKRRKRGSGS